MSIDMRLVMLNVHVLDTQESLPSGSFTCDLDEIILCTADAFISSHPYIKTRRSCCVATC